MDYRTIEFSTEKAKERIARALKIFPQGVLNRLLAFSLYVLGAKRRIVAEVVEIPEESVKTAVRVLMSDGFPAIQDRRRSNTPRVPGTGVRPPRVSARREDESCVVDLGAGGKEWRIPLANKVEVRTVLLSLCDAGLLPTSEAAAVLELSCGHCRALGRRLALLDVAEALVDKREGQKRDYRVGVDGKAEIIRQFAARTVTGHSTSSEVLAKVVNAEIGVPLSPRTVRWHMNKLGLSGIRKTLPELADTLKKN